MALSKPWLLRLYLLRPEAGSQDTRVASQLCHTRVGPWMNPCHVCCLEPTPSGSPFIWGNVWLIRAHPGRQRSHSPTQECCRFYGCWNCTSFWNFSWFSGLVSRVLSDGVVVKPQLVTKHHRATLFPWLE